MNIEILKAKTRSVIDELLEMEYSWEGIETFLKACTCEARLSSGAELKPHIIWWAKLELARRMMYNISNSHYPDTINPAQIKMIYDAEVRREPQENG